MAVQNQGDARRWKVVSAMLAGAVGFVVLAGRLEAPRDAVAQVPDAGSQRMQMIRELEASNRKLGEIAQLLREIRDQRADKRDEKGPGEPRGGR